MSSVEQLLEQLEDCATLIKKALINHKKAPKARLTKGYLKVRSQVVDDYWSTFKDLHGSLLKLVPQQERKTLPYFVNEEYDLCEEQYILLKTELTDLLESSSSTSTAVADCKGEVQWVASEAKLPRMDLPTFSGCYENWQVFEDCFITLIHNNTHLNNFQKLHYLKLCLTGEASATLKHYQTTDNNYIPAWDTLKKRYSHKRLILNSYLKKLFMQKKVQIQSSSQLKSFIDVTKECIIGLKNIGICTESWDPILLFISSQKLDHETHKEWEDYVSSTLNLTSDVFPTFNNLVTFLEGRIHALELTTTGNRTLKERSYHVANINDKICIFCNKDNHILSHCKEYGKLQPKERSAFAKLKGLCYNCLVPGHTLIYCNHKASCRICGKRHHSLLHEPGKKSFTQEENQNSTQLSLHTNVEEQHEEDDILEEVNISDATITSHMATQPSTALLATAILPVKGTSGQVYYLRALIDQGSQATFISERAAQHIKAKRLPVNGTISGVGSTLTRTNHMIQLELGSRYDDQLNLKVNAYVISTRLTTQLPNKLIPIGDWPHIQGLNLADPSFNKPGKIDLLLGVEVYAQIMLGELIKGPPNTPCAQNTMLGWIIFGKTNTQYENNNVISLHCLDVKIDEMMKLLWELEPTTKRELTPEERRCEEIYSSTHSRTKDGRYIVKLPLKRDPPMISQGRTREIALKRLEYLEKRFEKNKELKDDYTKVIQEYLELNHLEEVSEDEKDNAAVYLPHHAVVRTDKDTTKTRVVFDASCKGLNNVSLNDDLMVGPTLQEDLRYLIMRWRLKPICFVADIEKMYRAVIVERGHQDNQRILWRNNPSDEVRDYRLLRVTFGTASAPFLAIRTLHQVANDEGRNYDIESQIIKEDFFVDDLISGRDTVDEAVDSANKITQILNNGGFLIKKWSSNSESFLQQLKPLQINSETNIDIKTEGIIKTLGLTWNRIHDELRYQLKFKTTPEKLTKRIILAEAQKLFDPLGFLAPTIIPAKIIIQKLWVQGVAWDEETSPEIKKEWLILRKGLEKVNEVKIKRWLHTFKDSMNTITVHGFCDASTVAYAAAVYLRVVMNDRQIHTGLIAAKARVAPVKPVSLPRLELCGAVILSRLLKQVQEALRISNTQIFAWTDSKIVMAWLTGDPARWNVFVSNRVVEIIDNIGNKKWHHVTSENNPADIASRGENLPDLIKNKLWWNGPNWLQTDDIPFAKGNPDSTDLERKNTIMLNLKIEDTIKNTLKFEIFDSLQEMLRVIVYVLRFLNYKKGQITTDKSIKVIEMEDALKRIIKIEQRKDFAEEIERLKNKRNLSKNSKLLSLNPILDDAHILRVGGRIRHANIPLDSKHPMILGSESDLVTLIIADAHKKTLHGGLELTLNYLRARFWILRVKSTVKKYIHKCIICAKLKASSSCQLMGDLPKARVTPARPFINSGVDFAGPYDILMTRARGVKTTKAYISIFVCMCTKAIHIELVGDLSSQSFIGAFRRFVARRGRCTDIWSDQGRNFVGANKELVEAWSQAGLNFKDNIADILAQEGTQWHFIPAYSPNFGGLWEAGVKSMKYHLKR
ncbi:uncharacterized protein LOC123697818 isoform X1 [Colias croceus]|uniref:uncharacterized protein LOC123697818 isoform X1 n=2 Tax=Colias crocea TaxID=72248 RepID=UPI001E280252|nr:uncharacterized protein LOC123697818 isoform X1 [Colias croceus]